LGNAIRKRGRGRPHLINENNYSLAWCLGGGFGDERADERWYQGGVGEWDTEPVGNGVKLDA
jgi:hypothetical protein